MARMLLLLVLFYCLGARCFSLKVLRICSWNVNMDFQGRCRQRTTVSIICAFVIAFSLHSHHHHLIQMRACRAVVIPLDVVDRYACERLFIITRLIKLLDGIWTNPCLHLSFWRLIKWERQTERKRMRWNLDSHCTYTVFELTSKMHFSQWLKSVE